MRSTGFFCVSLALHGLAVAALVLTPVQDVMPVQGDKIEVQINEPADKAGIPEAPVKVEESQAAAPVVQPPAPQPVVEQPVAKPEVKVAPKPVPAPTPKKVAAAVPPKAVKAKTVPAAAKPVAEPSEDKDLAKSEPKAEPAPEAAPVQEEKPEFVPVKEQVAAAPMDSKEDEASAAKEEEQKPVEAAALAAKATPAPVAAAPAAAAVAAAASPAPAEDLAKGGSSKEGAVSYLSLKQMPGNKAPQYPMRARLESRQGQIELVYKVSAAGKVSDIQVTKSSGFADLDQEAVRAIAQYRFVPGQEGWARHPVNFALKGQVVSLPSQLRGKAATAD